LVTVLKPIETKGLQAADVEDLTRDTRELMLDEMIALTEKERGRPVSVPSREKGAKVVKASGAEATLS
jgi:lysophosphatidate acyltransferase